MVRTNLELEARVHLLDILELRECNWVPRRTSKSFTSKNLAQVSNHNSNFIYAGSNITEFFK